MTDLHCHAQRQLNPYNGVLQVARTDLARAISVNGVLWQIQVVAERPDHTWRADASTPLVRQFFNWGLWSADDGMRRVIANPILDIGAMAAAATALTDLLRPRLDALPFAMTDRYELWCCDYAGRPVALLGSACEARDIQRLSGQWHAVDANDRTFTSSSPALERLPSAGPRAAADLLESRVRQRAQGRHWFERLDDGSGRRLDGTAELTLPRDAFPIFGLTEDWAEDDAQLVRDYLDYSAPLLLMLQGLDDRSRSRLEQAALRQATLVADLFRLYPRIVDRSLIERARVEARLRRSG